MDFIPRLYSLFVALVDWHGKWESSRQYLVSTAGLVAELSGDAELSQNCEELLQSDGMNAAISELIKAHMTRGRVVERARDTIRLARRVIDEWERHTSASSSGCIESSESVAPMLLDFSQIVWEGIAEQHARNGLVLKNIESLLRDATARHIQFGGFWMEPVLVGVPVEKWRKQICAHLQIE